jgi:hypothetical protein
MVWRPFEMRSFKSSMSERQRLRPGWLLWTLLAFVAGFIVYPLSHCPVRWIYFNVAYDYDRELHWPIYTGLQVLYWPLDFAVINGPPCVQKAHELHHHLWFPRDQSNGLYHAG